MAENPYAQPTDFDLPPAEARTSVLAVLSLISGIAGLVVCCIPLIGLLGVALGVPALFSISASRGQKKGTGLAITGVVTGLIGAGLGTAMIFGISRGISEFAGYAIVFEHIEAQDVDAVRAEFASSVRSDITAERLAAFRAAYQAEVGAFTGMPEGLGEWLTAYSAMGNAGAQAVQSMGGVYQAAFPIPLQFDGGAGYGVLALEQGGAGRPPLLNLGVLPRGAGDVIWLLPPPGAGPDPAQGPGAGEGAGAGGG
ncbi:MAG: DUF4190 domain-containing protein [Phycisphaerales bacterium JB039]